MIIGHGPPWPDDDASRWTRSPRWRARCASTRLVDGLIDPNAASRNSPGRRQAEVDGEAATTSGTMATTAAPADHRLALQLKADAHSRFPEGHAKQARTRRWSEGIARTRPPKLQQQISDELMNIRFTRRPSNACATRYATMVEGAARHAAIQRICVDQHAADALHQRPSPATR